jgi:hypothetical protein
MKKPKKLSKKNARAKKVKKQGQPKQVLNGARSTRLFALAGRPKPSPARATTG